MPCAPNSANTCLSVAATAMSLCRTLATRDMTRALGPLCTLNQLRCLAGREQQCRKCHPQDSAQPVAGAQAGHTPAATCQSARHDARLQSTARRLHWPPFEQMSRRPLLSCRVSRCVTEARVHRAVSVREQTTNILFWSCLR